METLAGSSSSTAPSLLQVALTPGLSTGALYSRLPDEPVEATHLRWDAPTVGEWLAGLGLAAYAQRFVEHRITGDLLESMDREDLRDLGVHLVGHRLLLLREVGALRRKKESNERGKMLWQANEVVPRDGPLGYVKYHLCCNSCFESPDQYTLNRSALIIVAHDDQGRCQMCWSESSSSTRSIELSHIAGVTAQQRSRSCCDCGADECWSDSVVIDLNKELGLASVGPLSVRRGTGWQVAQLIQSAVEEANAQQAAGPPSPQTMKMRC